MESMFKRRAVFLDRDGTVIEAIHRPGFPRNSVKKKEITAPFKEEEVRFEPNAYRARTKIKEMGFMAILITNQPDVANGFMKEDVWRRIQRRVADTMGFDAVKICRHPPGSKCPNRKPLPGMLLSAADDYGIDLANSYVIGDTDADMKAGKAAGCTTILIDRFYNKGVKSDWRVADLMSAVTLIKVIEYWAGRIPANP